MSGYTPVDLAAACDLDVTAFQDPEFVPRGAVKFYGIPFEVGAQDDDTTRYCSIGAAEGRVAARTIAVGGRPTWLVFAHALLDSHLFEGSAIGEVCAEYTFTYADGATTTVPIRERFEIGVTPQDRPDRPIPLDWGQTPFLALPDLEPSLPHRTSGRFDGAGGRFKDVDDPSTRVPYRMPYRFFLWPFENPRNDSDLVSVELASLGPTLAVAGITTSVLDEEPFARTVFQDVAITLPPGEWDIDELTVEVERGSASFPYWAVPDGDELASSPVVPGWGHDPRSSAPMRAYVRIAANPSASIALVQSDEVVATAGWRALLEGGAQESAGFMFELLEPGRTWVRTTVRDADSHEPLPCRIHFHSAEGVPLAPHGHPVHINSGLRTFNLDIGGDVRLGGLTYAYIDGSCEGWLPLGRVAVEVAHGYEYQPLAMTVDVTAGMRELNLELKRTSRIEDQRYFSGDTHVHFVSTLGAELEARCEDVRVVNLLRTQGAELFTLTEEFTGRPHTSADGSTTVYVAQENRTGMFGHINLLGLREPVMPLSTGGPDESELGGGLDTGLAHWADECHDQGGTAILAHFPVPNGESASLIATGRLDAVEMVAHDPYNIREYYRYLDNGYQLPLVGGTDKMTAEVPIGLVRTYVHVPPDQPFDYFSWADNIKRGNLFTTSGPMLTLTVDDMPPGSEIRTDRGSEVVAHVVVESTFPVSTVEIMGRAGVLATRAYDPPRMLIDVEVALPIDGDTWIAARCFSPGVTDGTHHDLWRRQVTAHTSPVYVLVGETYTVRDPAVDTYMLTLIEGAEQHIIQRARRFWPGPVTHRHGEDDHLAYLLRPYQQARRAIEEGRR